MKRTEEKRRLTASKEFCDYAFSLAEGVGVVFAHEDAAVRFVDMLAERALDEVCVGMAPIGTLGVQKQDKESDDDLGALKGGAVDTGGAIYARRLRNLLAKQSKSARRGFTTFPSPTESNNSDEGNMTINESIYHSLAGKRIRECVNMGRSPSAKEIVKTAEDEGFVFDTAVDVDNFMKIALYEKLYPSVGPTNHANQLAGDKIPGAMGLSKEMQRLGPKDDTVGQNNKGARADKAKGTAPYSSYKTDGPKGSTQQFEQDIRKICPVCSKKSANTSAFCGACGAVLPPHPEGKDGGIPVRNTYGGKRNWNVEADGGTPKVRSPYGGNKSKNYYLKQSPPSMKEALVESTRLVISDLLSLKETAMDYSPTGVHDMRLAAPELGSVNARAQGLGVNPIEQGQLDRVVGLFQQGEHVKKVSMYSGVDVRLSQTIANMLGIGDTHGDTLGNTMFTASHDMA